MEPPIAILSHSTTLLRCHILYFKLALGTHLVYLVGSMNLDNGPNFALVYLVPVYSLDFKSAKSQGNAILLKIRPRCASLLKTKS